MTAPTMIMGINIIKIKSMKKANRTSPDRTKVTLLPSGHQTAGGIHIEMRPNIHTHTHAEWLYTNRCGNTHNHQDLVETYIKKTN